MALYVLALQSDASTGPQIPTKFARKVVVDEPIILTKGFYQ